MDEESGTGEMVAGGALGMLAACEALAGATVCPLCILAAPALIGVGVYKRLKRRKKQLLSSPPNGLI